MRKIVLLLICACLPVWAFAQTTAIIYATGSIGSYTTGSAYYTPPPPAGGVYTRNDNIIAVTNPSGSAQIQRGYAVFDLAPIPSGVTITRVSLCFYIFGHTAASYGSCVTYGRPGDLSLVTAPSTLYTSIPGGAVLWSASTAAGTGANGSYGPGVGNDSMWSTSLAHPSCTFIAANAGTKVSIGFTGGGTYVYNIAGETYAMAAGVALTGPHAPYLEITYGTPPPCTGTPTAGTVAASALTACATSPITLTVSGYTAATTLQWQSSPNSATWTDIAGATNSSYISPGITANTYYRVKDSCVGSGLIAVTPPVLITYVATPITGSMPLCVGSVIALSNAATGGVWSSTPASVATIGSTGILTGVSNGTATITYMVSGCASTATVQVNGPQVPQICVVQVDSATGKDSVIWNQFTPNRVARFIIYRQNSSSIFTAIDSQAKNVFSTYLDVSSFPAIQSYSYKLTARDSCGSESPLSSSVIHTTVHLNANVGVGGVINLIWNTYVGTPVTTQNILRSVGGGPFTTIASVANTVTSYTDAAPPAGALVYKINSVIAGTCSPSMRTTAGNVIHSNASGVIATGITNVVADQGINIYPNPATNELTIKMNKDAYSSFVITNSIGQVLMQQPISEAETKVNVKILPAGLYQITVRGDNGTKVQKFVKL